VVGDEAAHAKGDADMPSQAMQDLIDAFRDQQRAGASRAAPALEEWRATFAPAGRIHPVPDDVRVTEVIAGGVPAASGYLAGADPRTPLASPLFASPRFVPFRW
jgi:hypothetical protein